MFGSVEECVVVGIGAVRPMVAFEVVPQILEGVQLGGISRQGKECDVVRHHQLVGAMVSGSIPDEQGLHVRRQGVGELLQELVDDGGVQVRSDDGLCLSGLRTGSAKDPDIGILRLANGSGP
jgi:hypothetical protein